MSTHNAVERIAQICHEANRAYCAGLGDDTQKPWADAEAWQRDSAIEGVLYRLAHPDDHTDAQHEAWTRYKRASGWKYGPVKDAEKKEHPCLVPYKDLPVDQQLKDALFAGVVDALKVLVAGTDE